MEPLKIRICDLSTLLATQAFEVVVLRDDSGYRVAFHFQSGAKGILCLKDGAEKIYKRFSGLEAELLEKLRVQKITLLNG